MTTYYHVFGEYLPSPCLGQRQVFLIGHMSLSNGRYIGRDGDVIAYAPRPLSPQYVILSSR